MRKLSKPILDLTKDHDEDDGEIAKLRDTMEHAQTSQPGKVFYVAFVGDQGVGKSSIINGLTGRQLVSASSSSSACTAFPTMLSLKNGAEDQTDKSDMRIQYHSEEEMRDNVEEQVRRHEAAFPKKHKSLKAASLPTPDSYRDFDDEKRAGDEEEEEEEEILDDAERERVLQDGNTAKEFFHIIWGTEESEEKMQMLEHALDHENIECESFYVACLENVRERLRTAGALNGFTEFNAISDADLDDTRNEADRLWPLVKCVELKTGHRLLRENVCILDLPGKIAQILNASPTNI
jgi:GTPase SAR1 family protein